MKAKRSIKGKSSKKAPLLHIQARPAASLEVLDSTTIGIPALFLLAPNQNNRDPQAQATRMANQFILQNRGILRDFGITADLKYDGTSVQIILKTGTKIGALPLLSPTTGKPDYGLVIKPRFNWAGIGLMLSSMGWRVTPQILNLPLLQTSERNIPPWVLSSVILIRIKNLLDGMERSFEFAESELPAPRGSVNWAGYITQNMTHAHFLKVPCRYPDLRDNRDLKAAIHFTLRKQLVSLEAQRAGGIVVIQLIVLCLSLLERVRGITPKRPTTVEFNGWSKKTLCTEVFQKGLQAVEWAVDDRGLAGLSDLQGLPWVLSMEEFFEAWVETVALKLARRNGGILKVGRKRETVAPLIWDPPYLGSQKYMLPDLIIERENETIIIDAKYKAHWEEISSNNWYSQAEDIKERHRNDLFQVLAYSTFSETKNIVSCLVYPCTKDTWESLKNRNRLYHRASLGMGRRKVELVLTAVPMEAAVEDTADYLVDAIRTSFNS